MSLPPEILLHIFNHHLQTSNDNDLITPAQVCRYWRTVALSFPDLWAKVNIQPFPTMFDLTRTQLHLERSKATPLSITINDATPAENITQKTPIIQVLKAILSCASRWHSLCLQLPPPVFDHLEQAIASHESGGMEGCSNLRAASVTSYSGPAFTASIRQVWMFLHKSPCLEDVYWGATFERTLDIHFNFYPPLRRVSFHMSADGELLAILALLPTLEEVQMSNYTVDQSLVNEQPVLHRQLRKLSVTVAHDPSSLLSRLNLPSLSTLSISHIGPASHLPPAALKDFLLQSRCSLCKLSLQDLTATGSQLALYLQDCPFLALQDLSISSGLLDNDLVSLLSGRSEGNGHAFAPSLARLSLYTVVECTDGEVSEMIRGRFDDGNGVLRAAFVWGAQVGGSEHPIDIETMTRLYRMGLEGETV